MQSEGVRLKPVGGMDSDSGYLDVKNGNYISAKNIRHLTDEGQSTFEVQNVKGNKYLVTMPTATKTRKQQRIYVDKSGMKGTGTETWSITLVNSIGTVVASGTFVVSGASIGTTTTNIQNAINTMIGTLSGWSVSYAIQSSGDKIAVDVLVNAGNQYANYNFYTTAPANNDCDCKVYTIQEAINDGHTGILRPIAGYEIDGDVFLLSTTKDFMPSILDGIHVTGASSTTPIVITTSAAHGLTSGQAAIMTIDNVQGNTAANGTWLCVYASATQLTIIHSASNGTFTTSADSTITVDVESVSEIGVLQRNTNTDISKYTTLLRTTKLGLRACNMVDIVGESNPDKKSIYFTDDNQPIRCFYYKGDYVRGGAIYDVFSNTNGIYFYETVGIETRLIIANTNASFKLNKVHQTGGTNLSGNHVQFVRFLTDTLTPTDWLGPGGPVNIYSATYSDNQNHEQARLIGGDEKLEQTGKVIELSINSIPQIFKYIEVADIIFNGNSNVPAKSILLPRIQVNDRTDVIVQIYGNENSQDLDIGTLNQITAKYNAAKNVRMTYNRLVISNVRNSNDVDLSDWFKTFRHKLYKKTIRAVEWGMDASPISNPQQYTVNEFQLEENVNSSVGYMINETYRFFGRPEYYDGTFGPDYWIDDIKFDCDTSVLRRDQALSNFNLSYSNSSDKWVLVPYVQFTGFNVNEIIGDRPVRDFVKKIHIRRCIVDNPTILASGFIVPCVSGFVRQNGGAPYYYFGWDQVGSIGDHTNRCIIEYPFVAPNNGLVGLPTAIYYPGPAVSGAITDTFTAERKFGSFYSMDIALSGLEITPTSGDKILNWGMPIADALMNVLYAGSNTNEFVKYVNEGNMGNLANPIETVDVVEGKMCSFADAVILNGGASKISKTAAWENGLAVLRYQMKKSLIVRTTQDINPVWFAPGAGNDTGFYYAQYYRPLSNQYGDKTLNKTIPTGAIFEIQDQTAPVSESIIDVFGGDTFTNTVFHKFKHNPFEDGDDQDSDSYRPRGACGIRCFLQSRSNFSMRSFNKDAKVPNYPYGKMTINGHIFTDLESWFNRSTPEEFNYNKGYNVDTLYEMYKGVANNPNEKQATDFPTLIAWSAKKTFGSNVDSYRSFLPLDFKILDLSFGEIMGMEIANGEIFTFQPKEFKRHFFNTDGMFTSKDGAEVITGSGAVMSRRELDLSRYGSSNKWSIIKGSTISGKDAVYWISGVHKKVLKHDPSQGTTVISDVQNFESFTYNNLKWTIQWDSPIIYGGVSAVWNPRYSEAIWVVKARRDMPGWVLPDDPSTAYDTGAVVYFLNPSSKRTNPSGALWISLIDNNMHMPPDPGSPSPYWQEIPHTNTDYYNEWTFVFNEKNNSFTNFRSWGSPLLIPAWDTFLSTDPSQSNRADIYAHNEGEYCRWYSNGDSEIYEDGHIEMVINRYPSLTKTFEAIMCSCKIAPFKVEFWTEKHYSYLLESDFEKIEDGYWSPIKNDATVTAENPDGRNDIDTENLWGQYLRVKFHFEKGVQQSLKNITIKIQGNNRNDNQ